MVVDATGKTDFHFSSRMLRKIGSKRGGEERDRIRWDFRGFR